MAIFGRCLSKQEARKLNRTGRLYDPHSDLVPVFDSPECIRQRLNEMNRDQIRNYFRRIGVRNPQRIVFFELLGSTDRIVGPIPQKNGLIEYKLPIGTSVRVDYTIRL